MIFLLLKQLILNFVVVSEEKHLPVDESLEGVCFEAHIDQQKDIVQHFGV
jgi:hypothetical protein